MKVLVLLLFLGMGTIVTAMGIHGLISAGESVHWPTAQGEITTSTIEARRETDRRDRPGTTYRAQVRYQFFVDRQRFEGDLVAYGDYGSSDRGHAERITRRYPQGKIVTVYYRPGQPNDALLEPGIHTQTWFLPGAGLIFTGASLWAMVRIISGKA